MPLFRRRKDAPVDPDARSPQLGLKFKDLAVMERLMNSGADLSEPRHVLFYCYATSRETADAMGREAGEQGFQVDVREPLPEFPGQWAVVCEVQAVLSPDFVRDSGDFFDRLTERHRAEYDGWEAAV